MNRKLLLSAVLLLAFCLRFYALGSNPPALDWDEAALGYNAYSLLKTGRDEYAIRFPLSIKSFNDYKPPLYTYISILPVAAFGLNEFSVRFTSAFFGLLTVAAVYLLLRRLFRHQSAKLDLLAALFLAVSPWHLQFSRVAFEANLALFFLIWGIFLLTASNRRLKFYLFSAVSLALSMYAYHSPRLIVPLLLAGILWIYRSKFRDNLKQTAVFLVVFLLSVLPIAVQLQKSTSARFSSVSVVNPDEKLGESIKDIEFDQEKGIPLGRLFHNRRLVYFREILGGYLDHFNFDFLFLTGDPPGRHHASGMGMLYLWELPFILAGIFLVIARLKEKKSWQLFAWWFLAAPVASALTSGTPHAVRALFYLPLYQILSATGLLNLRKSFRFLVIPLFTFSFFYYLHLYYVITPFEYSDWWQYGYKESILTARQIEDRVDKVVVTYRYDQPYIFYLFYNLIDPGQYQEISRNLEIKRSERVIGKYEFRNIDWSKDKELTKTLFVSAPGEIPEDDGELIKEINFLNGQPAFRLVLR
ncbi:MAG: PMT family glycosyltransferase, 4-amino-4-deoxy-L-arabinose transferase [Candidatus Gottesmanbacteria bacterium GW2011_GWA2_43_14]|uniref:PMT family glycosyltransferase, 4-amino-4-deoxy-L-arabinose transferase n=1 Tax=Candidatus Gottesmanbacteria bacterium GW2011_GWA2_43_14 TaxID=1618443 RepID=A0A0G1DM67_9BACT|nr:MAG: PMT family glycosyltransferase, 4-amino-4-deoxy-L-arabinose transferase [Candidatus Gottesmanbacteria bacterium GW2011_GWA2_43_14]